MGIVQDGFSIAVTSFSLGGEHPAIIDDALIWEQARQTPRISVTLPAAVFTNTGDSLLADDFFDDPLYENPHTNMILASAYTHPATGLAGFDTMMAGSLSFTTAAPEAVNPEKDSYRRLPVSGQIGDALIFQYGAGQMGQVNGDFNGLQLEKIDLRFVDPKLPSPVLRNDHLDEALVEETVGRLPEQTLTLNFNDRVQALGTVNEVTITEVTVPIMTTRLLQVEAKGVITDIGDDLNGSDIQEGQAFTVTALVNPEEDDFDASQFRGDFRHAVLQAQINVGPDIKIAADAGDTYVINAQGFAGGGGGGGGSIIVHTYDVPRPFIFISGGGGYREPGGVLRPPEKPIPAPAGMGLFGLSALATRRRKRDHAPGL